MKVKNDAKMNYNHTPIPSFCSSSSKKKKRKILAKLLNHFHRCHDCTEHVQQAVKPLGYPRGGVLSPEGFQRLAPTKSQENVSEKKRKKFFMIHFFPRISVIYRFRVTLNFSFFL